MFLFINSYMRDLSDAIVGRLGIENRPMLFVPILLISGLITYGIIRLSTTVAVEIATYGK
jgi:3-dehydroquinate synthase class II